METPSTLAFDARRSARAVRVHDERELDEALTALELERGRPVLVLVGGAGSLSAPDRVRPVFEDALVPLAERLRAHVVDGGTAAGVMRLLGEARSAAGATFPLVGVAAEGTVALPDEDDEGAGRATLDPNHSHFVLVPGSDWGDEVPWLGRVAELLAGGASSATVLVEGGAIAWRDVEASVDAGRPVVALAGSGRTADELVATLDGRGAPGRPAERLARSGLLLASDSDSLGETLERLLGERP